MSLIALFAPKTGRHTQAGVIAQLRKDLAQAHADREKDTDKLANEIVGYQAALKKAANAVNEAQAEAMRQARGWSAAHAEVLRLRRILGTDANLPATPPVPALADTDEPWTAVPDPAPRDPEQLPPIALSLPRPATYEPADPAAETQAVPQVEQTQVMPIAVVEEATGIDATQVMPIVVPRRPLEPTPAVTWGRTDPETAQIEARLNIPGPDPFASATAIPRTAIDNAVTSVRAAVTEAAS